MVTLPVSNMNQAVLHIKNMVCPRCIWAVHSLLEQAGCKNVDVVLGIAHFDDDGQVALPAIEEKLVSLGFSLITEKDQQQAELIKVAVIRYLDQIQENRATPLPKLSEFLSNHMGKNYSYISTLFSKHFGLTLEHYYLTLRIERVKELISYGELNVSEVASKLGYSSTQHLSRQFKDYTGLAVTEFKKNPSRAFLDSL